MKICKHISNTLDDAGLPKPSPTWLFLLEAAARPLLADEAAPGVKSCIMGECSPRILEIVLILSENST